CSTWGPDGVQYKFSDLFGEQLGICSAEFRPIRDTEIVELISPKGGSDDIHVLGCRSSVHKATNIFRPFQTLMCVGAVVFNSGLSTFMCWRVMVYFACFVELLGGLSLNGFRGANATRIEANRGGLFS